MPQLLFHQRVQMSVTWVHGRALNGAHLLVGQRSRNDASPVIGLGFLERRGSEVTKMWTRQRDSVLVPENDQLLKKRVHPSLSRLKHGYRTRFGECNCRSVAGSQRRMTLLHRLQSVATTCLPRGHRWLDLFASRRPASSVHEPIYAPAPILGSVPAISRAIFARWVIHTTTASTANSAAGAP